MSKLQVDRSKIDEVISIWASFAPGRVSIPARQQAAHDSKEGRVLRRQIPKDALDHLDESFLLYGPGIDDSVWKYKNHRDLFWIF